MSKFKANDKVIVKATGKIGVIKSCDMIDIGDGRVKVEYIVKTGNGFENWHTYSKKELEKIVPAHVNKPNPTLVVNAPNGYKVTLVALVINDKVIKPYRKNGVYDPHWHKVKYLRIGYAIYNPDDEYDHDFGVRVATKRAKKNAFCHLFSDFSGEFNTETVDALLRVKADYIVRNIDKFIP